MFDFSVRKIAASVRSRRTTAVEIIEASLSLIEAYDKVQAHAWIERPDRETVLGFAREIDRRLAAGEDLPLAGVPFAVKDNIDVQGLSTTAGCPAFAFRPECSATVVKRLLDAGAIVMGKTNLDQFATGLVGSRSPYGAPGCVFNRDYVSGGSSSGSAVVTAAGLVAFALGTDTAGSGRVPAAFNSLVGFKPTKGRWSTTGLIPACRSLDCITVFTRDSADAILIDQVVQGLDESDPFSRQGVAFEKLPRGFEFGVARPEQLHFFGDDESEVLYKDAIERVRASGGTAVEVDIDPLLAVARLLYNGPWVAERTAAVGGFLQKNANAVHPVVRAILEGGAAISAVAVFQGIYDLQAYARVAERMWTSVDVLVLPTAPTIYRIADTIAEPFELNARLGTYTNFVNLLDMSAVAVPAGFRKNRTGFGVTLIGPAWADNMLLALASRYEEVKSMPSLPELDTTKNQEKVRLAVVGAHLAGMPLHWQLTSRDATFIGKTTTAPHFRLYAIANTSPPKPALIHTGDGAPIEVEVYEMGLGAFGSFVAEVPPPLAIGTVELRDGTTVKGFVAEPRAVEGEKDITALGGWRAYCGQPSPA